MSEVEVLFGLTCFTALFVILYSRFMYVNFLRNATAPGSHKRGPLRKNRPFDFSEIGDLSGVTLM
jgi:hypothetical protein